MFSWSPELIASAKLSSGMMLSELGAQQLVGVAVQMESTALLQRLGFVADLVAADSSKDMRAHLRLMNAKSARSNFGRAERKTDDVGYVADWGLFVNARKQDCSPTFRALHPLASPHDDNGPEEMAKLPQSLQARLLR